MPTSHQSPICGLFEFPGVLRLCGSSLCSQKKLIILRCIHHGQTYPIGDLVESLFVIVLSDVQYNLLITGSNIHQHSASTCIHQNHPKTIQKHPKTIQKPFQNHPKTIPKPSKNEDRATQATGKFLWISRAVIPSQGGQALGIRRWVVGAWQGCLRTRDADHQQPERPSLRKTWP